MSAEWKNGLCGCFGNPGICLITFFVPCYQFGKNAEAVGENCGVCCLVYMIPVLNILAGTKVRGSVREQKGIEGGVVGDFLAHLCCAPCAIVQEAQELAGAGEGGQSMARE
ncbi:hypothetical protein BaRGS_00008068 [Batillaria attramentaria]|uniref:Uncharacterized protein n=1 Tax=Batillaria attramentaria TaxID=370345 RepID=A0ABD0LMI6_9CAEN